jgi:hypothetical protein
MEQTQQMEIARLIVAQIQYLDRWALLAYGAMEYRALPESKEFKGGLRFSVTGQVHQGFVYIQLRWVDDYTITFSTYDGVEVEKFERVYFDQLIEFLDFIEEGKKETKEDE